MTLSDFARLDKPRQVQLFWQGVLIGQRLIGQSMIECRQIDGFYVEYTFLKKQPHNFRCFQNPDRLQPYLHTINIQPLLSY
ncbi:MAG: hypothetical protein M3Q06_11600 [Bacteroidota bacterium]|nr:hypothetical protein [Bacteroidota bacterium]